MKTVRDRAPFAALWFPILLVSPLALEAAQEGGTDEGSPVLVSPSAGDREARVGPCPTFSWTSVPGARGYELVVYASTAGLASIESSAEPLIRLTLPAGASSWTPSLDECLAADRYAWAVRAITASSKGREAKWSRPALFRVEAPATLAGQPAVVMTAPQAAPLPHAPIVAVAAAELPPCAGNMFFDVPLNAPYCQEIEQLARDGITEGCGGGNYCPKNPVSREQVAALLQRSIRGTATWSPDQTTPVNPPPAVTSIEEVDNAANVGQHTSITIGADGLPIVSFYDASAGTLKVAHCNDIACAGSDETITTADNPSNTVGQYTSIAIGSDGLPIISYHDATAGSLKVAHCNDLACSQPPTITVLDDQAQPVGLYTSITITTAGLAVISYYDAGNFALKAAHCSNVGCTLRTIHTLDDPVNHVGEYTSIALGRGGFPVISYHDATDGALKVAWCSGVSPTPCSTATTETVHNPAEDVGEHTSIAIGTDGYPIVSYVDATLGNLLTVHCNDDKCAPLGEQLNNQGGNFGQTSLTIGADGLPVISARNEGSNTLQVFHCNDIACAGDLEETHTIPEPGSADWGEYNALTVGNDGLPVVAYYDASATALKVAHCTNRTCAPYFRRR